MAHYCGARSTAWGGKFGWSRRVIVKPFVKRDGRTLISDAPPQADFRSGFAALAPPLAFTSAAWSLTVCSA
jgi:hypothetical protein